MVAAFDLSKKRLMNIENNATGQFAKLLKSELDLSISDCILQYNGACFTVEEIYQSIRKKLPKGAKK
jgi:2-oxoglutarate ferredoxin oxidoreductase subunit alpha